MALLYKYPNEEEVIIDDGEQWHIDSVANLDIVYEWEAIGTFTNNTTGSTETFAASLGSNPNYNPEISVSLTLGKRGASYYNTVTGEQYEGRNYPSVSRWFSGAFNLKTTTLRPWYSGLYGEILEYPEGTPKPGTSYYSQSWSPSRFLEPYRFIKGDDSAASSSNPITVPVEQITQDSNLVLTHIHPSRTAFLRRFRVYSGGVIIFSRTDENAPEYVQLLEGECPSNTCAVDCGVRVCCYNSQGISVFNYLK